jgi:hypothetical protein
MTDVNSYGCSCWGLHDGFAQDLRMQFERDGRCTQMLATVFSESVVSSLFGVAPFSPVVIQFVVAEVPEYWETDSEGTRESHRWQGYLRRKIGRDSDANPCHRNCTLRTSGIAG